jgi:hypothetical protein
VAVRAIAQLGAQRLDRALQATFSADRLEHTLAERIGGPKRREERWLRCAQRPIAPHGAPPPRAARCHVEAIEALEHRRDEPAHRVFVEYRGGARLADRGTPFAVVEELGDASGDVVGLEEVHARSQGFESGRRLGDDRRAVGHRLDDPCPLEVAGPLVVAVDVDEDAGAGQ